MGSVNNGCTFLIQLNDSLKDLISALWIDGNRRLVEDDQFRLVCDTTGDIQSAQQSSGKLLRIEVCKIFKPYKCDRFLDIFPA